MVADGRDGRHGPTVRYGFKHIEFEKGKAGIAVPSKEKLVSVIETVIELSVRANSMRSLHSRAGRAELRRRNASRNI